jgi:hypothetical protein
MSSDDAVAAAARIGIGRKDRKRGLAAKSILAML